jgi:hypothetical protein
MKVIKTNSFKTFTSTSSVDGVLYIIPSENETGIEVSDEVAAAFKEQFLHEIDVQSPVIEEPKVEVPEEPKVEDSNVE